MYIIITGLWLSPKPCVHEYLLHIVPLIWSSIIIVNVCIPHTMYIYIGGHLSLKHVHIYSVLVFGVIGRFITGGKVEVLIAKIRMVE